MKRIIRYKTPKLIALAAMTLTTLLFAQEPARPKLKSEEIRPGSAAKAAEAAEAELKPGKGGKPDDAKPTEEKEVKPGGVIIGGGKTPVETAKPKETGLPIGKGGKTPDAKKGDAPAVTELTPGKGTMKRDLGEPTVKEIGAPKEDKKSPNEGKPEGEAPPAKGAAQSNEHLRPVDFEAAAKRRYDSLDHKDVSLEEFLGFERLEADRLQKLKDNPGSRFRLAGAPINGATPCQNGDFEPGGLQPGAWGFGYGSVIQNSGIVDYPNFTAAQSSGLITVPSARQTPTVAGVDPNVGIQMTGPDAVGNPTAHALRIGNAVNGAGAELISKTFTVTSAESTIRFWYAAVFHDWGHPANQQPAFTVRVLDGGGIPVQGLVDLGNSSDKIVASSTNPFFKTKPGGLVYKDWSCAQINLSSQIGKTVTIQFVTQDCSQGGDWGYAYIDNVCGKCTNSSTGDIQFNKEKSSKCGPGNICFDYSLPKDGNATGTGIITLNIFQAGSSTPVKTLTSPTLSAGTSYCFPIEPGTLGPNPALGGFDFSATGAFTLGTNVTKLTTDPVVAGNNNDYKIKCDVPPTETSDSCCGGKNLVPNGGMDLVGERPRSGYEYIALNGRSPLLPGSFTLINVEGLGKACPTWKLPAACNATKDFTGGVMLVNGLTNQAAGKTGVILDQNLSLPKPEKGEEAEYKICFHYLPLPACCFDVVPKLKVVVTKGGGAPATLTNVSDVATGCGHLYSANFKAPQGAANLQILLAEDGRGDGNDLMIDNVSIRQLAAVPTASMMFNLVAAGAGGGNYHITLNAPASLTNPPYNWEWEVSGPGINPPITVGGNPSTNFGNKDFSGSNQYTFKLKVWSPCHALSGSKQIWSFAPNFRKAQQQPEEDSNPEPVKASK